MAWFSEGISTMDDLFVHTLQDIYYAERKIETSLPDMIAKASDAELKRGFRKHLGETRNQIKRLDKVFKLIERKPEGTRCPAIDGIIEEANDIAADVEDKMVLNAALIAAAQAVEHYEITRYGALAAWARVLGRTDIAKLLSQNLKEEKATDTRLSGIARRKINRKAAARKPKKKQQTDMLDLLSGIPAI